MNDYKELPRLKLQDTVCRVVFGFGFHPLIKEYKVVKIVYYKLWNHDFSGGNPEAFVLTLGKDDQWMNLGEIPYSLNGPTSEALVAGRLHWRSSMAQDDGSNSKAIMSFDLGTQQFQPVPGSEFLSGGNSSNLANLRGCLSAAVLNGDGSTDMGYEELQHQGIMEQGGMGGSCFFTGANALLFTILVVQSSTMLMSKVFLSNSRRLFILEHSYHSIHSVSKQYKIHSEPSPNNSTYWDATVHDTFCNNTPQFLTFYYVM
ncbi:F-box protein At3g07870 [Linum perenne]